MKKQLVFKNVFHRCHKCGRGLKKSKSILRGMGKVCHKKDQKYLKGLRELAEYENS